MLYIDGISRNSTASSCTLAADNSKNLEIARNSNAGNQFFNGQIDDARMYNYALTPVQVRVLYNNGVVNFSPSTGAP